MITSTELEPLVDLTDPDSPLPSIEQPECTSEGHLVVSSAEYRPRTPSISLTPPSLSQFTFASPYTPSRGSSYTENTPTPQGIDEQIATLRLHDGDATESNTNNQRASACGQAARRDVTSAEDNDLANAVASMNLTPDRPARTSFANGAHLRPASASPALSVENSVDSRQSTPRRRSSSAVDRMPHRVEDEEPPASQFHDIQLQHSLSQTRDIVADVLRTIEVSSLRNEADSSMRKLHKQAESLVDFKSPADRIVGLVGDSGVGSYRRSGSHSIIANESTQARVVLSIHC